ncbi:MAG: MCE family protein [Pirellulales bacterium]|nr:MCE family protein [Pirellulales bacterium]
MDDRKLRTRVGFLVAGTILVAGILISLLGNRPALFQGTYKIKIIFPDAPSVTVNTPIRKSGILIGRVDSVELLDEGGVQVVAKIHDNIKLSDNETCEVQSSLLGDAEIRFRLPPGQKPSGRYLAPDEEIQGTMAADPLQVVADLQGSLSGAIGSVSDASHKLSSAAQEVTDLLKHNEQDISSIIGSLRGTTDFTGELFEDKEFRANLKREVTQLPQMFEDARSTITTLRTTMDKMNQTMAKVDTSLDDINAITKPLGKNSETMVREMTESIQKLNQVMDDITVFSQAINNRRSSLGRLLHDDQLYQHLNQAAANIDDLTTRMRPIVNDVRILSDKLARHPGVIIRDAVRPGPGTKGLPPMPRQY